MGTQAHDRVDILSLLFESRYRSRRQGQAVTGRGSERPIFAEHPFHADPWAEGTGA